MQLRARVLKAADLVAERLMRLGVRCVFGVGGANIEDIFAAVQRRRPEIRVVLSKHEHAAGCAADGFARIGGGIGVVLATSGGAAMNLVHALAEARASRVPLLAIVGEPPSDVQGRGAFQDTSGAGGAVDALAVFSAVSAWAGRVASAADVPRLFDEALAAARGVVPGPAVLLIAKDRQLGECEAADWMPPPRAMPALDEAAIGGAVALIGARPTAIIAGDEIARSGAAQELARFAEVIDALVAVTPDGRDAFDNYDPRFCGVAGALGHEAATRAVAGAEVVIAAGTRLPLLARLEIEPFLAGKTLISLGREPPFVGAPSHLAGDVRVVLDKLAGAATPRRERRRVVSSADHSATTMCSCLRAIEGALPPGAIVAVDAGNTGASAVHEVRVRSGDRWLIAMGMAGMGWTFGAAVGASLASRRRVVAIAGDGAFYMNGLDVHTAVEHNLPITYVVLDNSAHGMCLVREQLLLGDDGGYNSFRRSHLGAGMGAMFPGLFSAECRNVEELSRALARAFAGEGPSLISVELGEVEVPPFSVFRRAGLTQVSRGGKS